MDVTIHWSVEARGSGMHRSPSTTQPPKSSRRRFLESEKGFLRKIHTVITASSSRAPRIPQAKASRVTLQLA